MLHFSTSESRNAGARTQSFLFFNLIHISLTFTFKKQIPQRPLSAISTDRAGNCGPVLTSYGRLPKLVRRGHICGEYVALVWWIRKIDLGVSRWLFDTHYYCVVDTFSLNFHIPSGLFDKYQSTDSQLSCNNSWNLSYPNRVHNNPKKQALDNHDTYSPMPFHGIFKPLTAYADRIRDNRNANECVTTPQFPSMMIFAPRKFPRRGVSKSP